MNQNYPLEHECISEIVKHKVRYRRMHVVYFYLSKVKKQERLLILFRCAFIEGYKVKQGNEECE